MRQALFYRVCNTCGKRAVRKDSSLCQVCYEVENEIDTDSALKRLVRLFYDG